MQGQNIVLNTFSVTVKYLCKAVWSNTFGSFRSYLKFIPSTASWDRYRDRVAFNPHCSRLLFVINLPKLVNVVHDDRAVWAVQRVPNKRPHWFHLKGSVGCGVWGKWLNGGIWNQTTKTNSLFTRNSKMWTKDYWGFWIGQLVQEESEGKVVKLTDQYQERWSFET